MSMAYSDGVTNSWLLVVRGTVCIMTVAPVNCPIVCPVGSSTRTARCLDLIGGLPEWSCCSRCCWWCPIAFPRPMDRLTDSADLDSSPVCSTKESLDPSLGSDLLLLLAVALLLPIAGLVLYCTRAADSCIRCLNIVVCRCFFQLLLWKRQETPIQVRHIRLYEVRHILEN